VIYNSNFVGNIIVTWDF